MPIGSICITDVVTISKKSKLKEVTHLMEKYHVGSVVVTDSIEGNRIPVGIITDRDIALSMNSTSNPQDTNVEIVMQSNPISAKTTDGIFDTIVKMRDYGVKRLPVVNGNGTLFGILCADDLLTLMGEEINILSMISEIQISKEKGERLPTESHIDYGGLQ